MQTDFTPDPAGLLVHLQSDLTSWCTPRKGVISIAGDPGDVLESLADAPKSFRVTLCWSGDDDQAGHEEAGIVDNHFEVWLIKAKGMRINPGESLVKGTKDDPAFLKLLADLRARVRSLAFPEDFTYGRLFYKGCKPFPSPELAFELPTVGYVMRFDLTAAIPATPLRR